MSYLEQISRPRLMGLSIVLAIVLFLSVNVIAGNILKTARADLTENALYSLSNGTMELLARLEEPLYMRYFLSESLIEQAPQLASYAKRVRSILETYTRLAKGKITLEVINPKPFSPEEDRAVGLGVNRISLAGAPDPLFFGLAVTNSTDGEGNIPVFAPEREAFLEYDLTRLIAELGQTEKPIVTIIDGIGLQGDPRAGTRKQVALSQLEEIYSVQYVNGNVDELPENTRVVLAVHPQNLSDRTLYTLDQWVLGGGATMIFVDPHAELQKGPQPGLPALEASSNLEKLFDAWGVAFDTGKSVADPKHAIRTVRNLGGRQVEVTNYPWLSIRETGMDKSNPMLSQLSSIVMTTAGSFSRTRDGVSLEPLLTGSPDAGLIETSLVSKPFGDPRETYGSIEKADKPLVLAARLNGTFESAFTDGKPKASKSKAKHRGKLADRANVILVGDVDMLMDRNWVQHRQVLGQTLAQAFANNGDFLLNAAEQMAGGVALADLRGRGVSWRPFERIAELQKVAEAKHRSKEQQLVRRMRELEDKIRELDATEGSSEDFVSEKGAQMVEQFRADLLQTRAELRDVQHDLRRDVEQLQTWITTLNVGLIPTFIAASALAFALRRPRRKPPVRTQNIA